MKKLSNIEISNLNNKVDTYKEEIIEEAYNYYKKIQDFVNSNSMKGLAGESVFNYYTNVHFFLINKIMNVITEISQEAEAVTQAYLSYESADHGIVNTRVVEEKKDTVKNILTEFEQHDSRLRTIDGEISHIAGVQPLNGQVVFNEFENTITLMDDIIENLESEDSNLANRLSDLESRVDELKTAITDIENNYKTSSGFSSNKVSNITSATWYSEEEIDVFSNKFDESPYIVKEVDEASYTTEVGMETDTGTHVAGVSANSWGYDHTLDGEDFSAGAYYNGLEGRYEYTGQYSEADVLARVGYGGIEVDNSGFLGSVEGEVGVAQAEGSAMAGTDNWNVHVDGEAGVLTAEGRARADSGGIGFNGNVSLAHAGTSGGFTAFGTDVDVGVSVGKFGGGIDIGWDKLEFEINLGVGFDLTIDFPW